MRNRSVLSAVVQDFGRSERATIGLRRAATDLDRQRTSGRILGRVDPASRTGRRAIASSPRRFLRRLDPSCSRRTVHLLALSSKTTPYSTPNCAGEARTVGPLGVRTEEKGTWCRSPPPVSPGIVSRVRPRPMVGSTTGGSANRPATVAGVCRVSEGAVACSPESAVVHGPLENAPVTHSVIGRVYLR